MSDAQPIAFSRHADLATNWSRLFELTHAVMTATTRDAIFSADQLRKYEDLLNYVRGDRVVRDVRLLGLERAPGSKNRHHNSEGGLVRHMLQMWECWISVRHMLSVHGATHETLSDANVWLCILHHDLNKVWKYKLVSASPWRVDYAGELDRMTYLLGDQNKIICLLGNHGITLSVPLLNALITSEGGFSKQRPETETALAKVAYLLDEMSANVIDRIQTGRFWDSKDGGIHAGP